MLIEMHSYSAMVRVGWATSSFQDLATLLPPAGICFQSGTGLTAVVVAESVWRSLLISRKFLLLPKKRRLFLPKVPERKGKAAQLLQEKNCQHIK